jgi:hypothetical protein
MEQTQQLADARDSARTPADTNVRSFSHFLKWGLATTLAGASLAMLLVATVDPYHLFGFVDVAGFNHVKPLPEQYREQIKLAQARAVRPNMIFLGHSRVEIGLDPENAQLRQRGFSAYNMALSGTGIGTAQYMYRGIRDKAVPPAAAVVGVEFLDFLLDPARAQAPAAPSAIPAVDTWPWRFDTLFSLGALSDAARTVAIQHDPEAQTITSRGLNPLLEYHKYARQEGYFSIFQQRAQENAKSLVRRPHGLTVPGTGSSSNIDELRRMLTTMAQDGTEVHLLIYPYHAQLLAMFEEAGLQPVMEEWKQMLVREVDAVRRREPKARITLWDFSGFSPIQCERIPPPESRSATRWYWEAGHFKSAVGDMMLDRMLGRPSPIGFTLTADNVEQNRQRIAVERAACMKAYPEVFDSGRALVDAARRQLR